MAAAVRRILHALGFHAWRAIENEHGGRPMRRVCTRCGRKQVWNYALAREHGIVRWVDVEPRR